VVDDEVVWQGDRRSIRDTGFGSMDRSTESRLATPEDFRRSPTIKDNTMYSGVSPTVICDDLRRARAPKNVTFRGSHRMRRDSSSSASGKSADCSGGEESMDESPRRRRYGGYRGRAPTNPMTHLPARPEWNVTNWTAILTDVKVAGKPRHFDVCHQAPPPGELRHAAAQPRYHGSGRCSGGSLPRLAPRAVRPDDRQRALPYCDRDHSKTVGTVVPVIAAMKRRTVGALNLVTDRRINATMGTTTTNVEVELIDLLSSSRASRPVLPTLKLVTYNASVA